LPSSLVFELKIIIQGFKFKGKSFTPAVNPLHPWEQAAAGLNLPFVTGLRGEGLSRRSASTDKGWQIVSASRRRRFKNLKLEIRRV